MIIEHAERFGLSQLHQLRGASGAARNNHFCVLLTGDKKTAVARERLGNYGRDDRRFPHRRKRFGDSRAGRDSRHASIGPVRLLKIGNIIRDLEILDKARQEAEFYLTQKRLTRKLQNLSKLTKADARFRLAGIG
jgi:ATP-dependent DNA helicase RecG